MIRNIEFYNTPDGNIAVKPDDGAMFYLTEKHSEIISEMLTMISELYPQTFRELSELYSKSIRNKAYFEYRIVHRFIRCNFGEYDALNQDIDHRGIFHFEHVRCPLRGECRLEGIVCNPKVNSKLSEREKEVLRLLSEGDDNREIADKLAISPNTVKNHIMRMKIRLGLESKLQLVAYYQSIK